MLGNPDIWREILSYSNSDFNNNVSIEGLDQGDTRTILHVALLSSEYVELGLDALWRTMRTLDPIVKIINGQFGRGLRTDTIQRLRLGWLLHRPIEAYRADLAKRYLSRIRYFQLTDVTLCCFLSGVLMNGGCLLPNLVKLFMKLDAYVTLDWNSIPHALMSPTLRHVTYNCRDHNEISIVVHHLNVFKLLDLTCISYYGNSYTANANELIKSLTRFRNLQKLIITGTFHSDYTVDYLFSQLSNLTSLSIDASIFAKKSGTFNQSPHNTIYLPHLRELWIEGWCSNIDKFINCIATSGTLTFLDIRCTRRAEDSSRQMLDRASSTFPLTTSLVLEWRGDTNSLTCTDLSAFLNRRHLTSFRLIHSHHSLTSDDIIKLIRSWPNLETFEIKNAWVGSWRTSYTVLSDFSTLPCLQHLTLPLDFTSVESKNTESCQGIAPLQTLTLSRPVDSIHDSFFRKSACANYLTGLFPSLRWITLVADHRDYRDNIHIRDLQVLISRNVDIMHGVEPS